MRSFIPAVLSFILTAAALSQGLNLRLKNLDGKKLDLADLCKNRPLVVAFWATWCHPCQDELRQLQQLYQAYADSGIGFLAVSIDEARDQSNVKTLISGHRYTFPVALDPEQRALKRFGFNDVPGTVILRRHGESLWKHTGYKSGDELKLEEEIKKLIIRPAADSAEPKPAQEERAE